MDAKQDLDARRGKGCNNASDYSKLALQGGHKGSLKHFASSLNIKVEHVNSKTELSYIITLCYFAVTLK